jgi:hypothetical protein
MLLKISQEFRQKRNIVFIYIFKGLEKGKMRRNENLCQLKAKTYNIEERYKIKVTIN